jgi:hypothetical protein
VSYLSDRAERAVISALLADPSPPFHLYGLAADDFSSPVHRAIFTALEDIAFPRPGTSPGPMPDGQPQHRDLQQQQELPATDGFPERRDILIAARLADPGITTADLAAWRREAPAFAETAHYAELVRAGAIYRDMAAAAERTTAQLTDSQTPDGQIIDVELRHDPDLVAHQRLLADTLTRHAAAFAALASRPPDAPETGYPAPASIDAPAQSPRAGLEDQVLAGLLADPGQIDVLRDFLTDNAFTSTRRRHIYRTMISMSYDGEPIEDLTVAWRVELETARAGLYGIDVNTPGSTPDETPYPVTEPDTSNETTSVYLSRLAVTVLTMESVVHAGRDLLAAHLHDTLPDPATLATAITTTRARATADARQPQAATPRSAATTVRPEQSRLARPSGYVTARPPGPLPAPGVPQPGAEPEQTPTMKPGARP